MQDSQSTLECVVYTTNIIKKSLEQDKKILWLLSGGSSIKIAVAVREQVGIIPSNSVLHVGLIDERYGPVNHPSSNWRQLMDAGFNTDGLTLHPILIENKTINECSRGYDSLLARLVAECDSIIASFGIGADGHTAGILPYSPLINEDRLLVANYPGPDYQRVSITPSMVSKIDEAIIFANGNKKWPVIKKFFENGPVDEIPARIIKNAKSYTIYTDYEHKE